MRKTKHINSPDQSDVNLSIDTAPRFEAFSLSKSCPPVASPAANCSEGNFWTRKWELAAALLCFLFGLALIQNIHPIGDGLWFWYARMKLGGKLLYSGMHLPLQPLFVLLTMWSQELFGRGWLASKILAILQLFSFCLALMLILGFLRWRDWERALLLLGTFGMTMGALYFRFDDYHVTGYCLLLFSVYILVRLQNRQTIPFVLLLGVLSGLAISDRLNDGAMLLAAVGIALPFFVPKRRLLALALFTSGAAAGLLGIIVLTGDSLREWLVSTVLRAAALKGGTANVLTAPLSFPRAMVSQVHHSREIKLNLLFALVTSTLCVLSQRYGGRKDRWYAVRRIAYVAIPLALLFPYYYSRARTGDPIESLATLAVPLCFALSLWVLIRGCFFVAGQQDGWSPLELLLLIPSLQLIGGAMTSGKSVLEAYPPVAFALLLLPLSLPMLLRAKWQKTGYLALAAFIAVSAAINKNAEPYHWHHFEDRALFQGRQWYRHPLYGPMYIESDQLKFMQSVCSTIGQDGRPESLLSITNPYPNYFCGVPPWHDYVQTWYDTTSRQTMDSLLRDLQVEPPQWIIYQRALDSIKAHEKVFLNGQPLPHRALDQLIMRRLMSNQWTVVQRRCFEGADWILIRSDPPSSQEQHATPDLASDRTKACDNSKLPIQGSRL